MMVGILYQLQLTYRSSDIVIHYAYFGDSPNLFDSL